MVIRFPGRALGLLFSFWLLCGLLAPAQAQSFVWQALPGALQPIQGTPYWADIDNDGDLDVMVSRRFSYDELTFFRNDSSVFIQPQGLSIWLGSGPVDFADFNQDGWMDVLSNRRDISRPTPISPFNGCYFDHHFKDPPETFPYAFGRDLGACQTQDDDGDGDVDILFNVQTDFNRYQTKVYRSVNGFFQEAAVLTTGQLPIKEMNWDDFDGDGDPDILLWEENSVKIFQNQGGTYQAFPLDVSAYLVSAVRWADTDNDGDLDLIIVGQIDNHDPHHYNSDGGFVVFAFQNGSYEPVFSDFAPNRYERQINTDLGDADNDGDLDLLVKFNDAYGDSLRIFRNLGNHQFRPWKVFPLAELEGISFQFVDYDQDGDQDISGGTFLYVNQSPQPAPPPASPTGLTAIPSGHSVQLSWKPASDAHTATAALTYNIHIQSSVKELPYLNGLSYLPNGARSIQKRGNAYTLTSKQLRDLPDGVYHWTVQAINQTRQSSAYAPWQSFTIQNGVLTKPSITFGNIQSLNSCECSGMSVEVKLQGQFGASNHFFLQLSDSTGSFAQPVTLFNGWETSPGYQNGLNPQGMLGATIPASVRPGTHYRVRVVSTDPVVVSPDNGYDVAIRKRPQMPGLINAIPPELCPNPPDTKVSLRSTSQYANTYSWEMEPSQAGIITGSGLEAVINWNDTFAGKVQITVRGVNGCGPGQSSFPRETFIRPAIPAPGPIRKPENICTGQGNIPLEIDLLPGVNDYQWELPSGITFVPNTPTNQARISVQLAASFQKGVVKVAGKDDCGLGEQTSVELQIRSQAGAAGSITGPDTLCELYALVTFSTTPIANALLYQWEVPEGFFPAGIQTTQEPLLQVMVAKRGWSGVLKVRGVDACFVGEPSSKSVMVLDVPPSPERPVGPTQVCPGKTRARYTIPAVNEASAYQWLLAPNMTSVSDSTQTQQAEIEVEIEADFMGGEIQVSASNACGNSLASPPLVVNPFPNLEQPVITRSCDLLQVNAQPYPVQWYLNGEVLSGQTNPALLITQKGKYTVQVNGPCTTASLSLEAEPLLPTLGDIPNVITPNGDASNETFQIADKLLGSSLMVFNRWGQEVYYSNDYANNWDGAGLSVGAYFYILTIPCLSQPITGTISILR